MQPPLTPRERQVLDLIAQGRTNAEIAAELGVSFSTAKSHVSNVLIKLGVESREEAARWRDTYVEPARPSVFARWVRGLGGLPWPRIGMAAGLGALAVGAVAIAALVVLALPNDGDTSADADVTAVPTEASPTPPAASPTAGATPTGSPSPEATPTNEPSPDATVTPTFVAPTPVGLFTEPRETAIDAVRTLPPRPESPFEEWDGQSTVIYDLQAGTELNLGPGSWAHFSESTARAQWTRGENVSHDPGEQWIIDLETGEQHPRGTNEAFDIAQPLLDYTTPDGYAVQGASHPRRDDPGRNLHDLEVKILAPESQNPVLMFDAFETAPAGDGHVVAATPVDGTTTNIFLIDIESGAAEFIATAPVTSGIAWSLDANDDYIVWADDVCQFAEPGRFSIYDRRSGAITQVTTERSPAVSLTPDGSIALGALGVEALVSPTTLMYEAVFPSVAPGWSSDMRYASIGQWTKAFGLCA